MRWVSLRWCSTRSPRCGTFRTRPGANFGIRILRGLLLFLLFGAFVVVTAGLAALGALLGDSLVAGVAGFVAGTCVSVGLYLVVFRMLSPKDLNWKDLLPGAIVAGVGWQLLETLGVQLVQHQLKHSSQLYGTVGVVLGLIWFLLLVAQITLYGIEINIVRVQHLWPRSMIPPPLTPADRDVLENIAEQEERVEDQRVTVEFEEGVSR